MKSKKRKRLCCLVNPQFYCDGCGKILCEECVKPHFGAAGYCIHSLFKGHKWILKEYEKWIKKQEKKEDLTFRFEEGVDEVDN